jgi:hypothetical protein
MDTEQLVATARAVRDDHPPAFEGATWPDCYETVTALRATLVEQGVPEAALDCRELWLSGEYAHTVLVCDASVCGVPVVVDPTFDQFGSDTPTPFAVAPSADIAPVAVVPVPEYVFADCL